MNHSNTHSLLHHLTEIKTFPSKDKVNETVGFTPKYVESFNNGFKFDTFNYANNEVRNEKGDATEKYKSADFDYKKDGSKKGQILAMSAEKTDDKSFYGNTSQNASEVEYNGVKIIYTNSLNTSQFQKDINQQTKKKT